MAAAGFATSALAAPEEEHLLVYTSKTTEVESRAALPSGAPSVTMIVNCVAGEHSFTTCQAVGPTDARDDVRQAAVKLAMNKKFDPRDRNGRPIAGRTFETRWELLAPGDKNPDWMHKPTPESLVAVYPTRAMQEGRDGSAVIRCKVTVEGYLDQCASVFENPPGYGFGAAALALSSQFGMTPSIRGGRAVEGEVTIPVNWPRMKDMMSSSRPVLTDVTWAKTPMASKVKAAYPAKAAKVPSGLVMLRCDLAQTGEVSGCKNTSEIPSGKGFGAAALSLSSDFLMAVSPDEAKIPANIQVDIPVLFRNPTAPDDGRLTDIRWIAALSGSGAALLFPRQARAAGLATGVGVVNCAATPEGGLIDCKLVSENPLGMGFGDAALKAAEVMQMNRWTKTGEAVEGRRISVPIRLSLPQPMPPSPPKL